MALNVCIAPTFLSALGNREPQSSSLHEVTSVGCLQRGHAKMWERKTGRGTLITSAAQGSNGPKDSERALPLPATETMALALRE